jgi:hypothetical protein
MDQLFWNAFLTNWSEMGKGNVNRVLSSTCVHGQDFMLSCQWHTIASITADFWTNCWGDALLPATLFLFLFCKWVTPVRFAAKVANDSATSRWRLASDSSAFATLVNWSKSIGAAKSETKWGWGWAAVTMSWIAGRNTTLLWTVTWGQRSWSQSKW